MSSHHDDVGEFWGNQRDWTDSHARQRNTGRTRLTDRLKTGVNAIFDAGASASRSHGVSGETSAVHPTAVPDDLDFDLTPAPLVNRRSGDGLTIGELAQPWDSATHEATQPVPRVSVGVLTPPSNVSVRRGDPLLDLGRDDDLDDEPDPQPSDDYSGLSVEAEPWDPEWTPQLQADPPQAGVDPLLAKLGVLAVVLTLAFSLLLTTRDGGDDSLASEPTASTLAPGTSAQPRLQGSAGASRNATANSGSAAATGSSGSMAANAGDMAGAEPKAAVPQSHSVDELPIEPVCAAEYEIAEGDYWLRLADGSGVSLKKLLATNSATANTPLYPGGTICLPEGATTPPPPPAPTTAAPAVEDGATSGGSTKSSSGESGGSTSAGATGTTAPGPTTPTSTVPPATAPPTTAAPSTAVPTTAAPAPSGPTDVEAIIRSVWPDSLEDRALEIAWRESNHQPTAQNYCCYGLFQIYYSVHQSWLADLGITQSDHLFDPRLNSIAAYTLYQRDGGWGPWGG